MDRPRGHRRRVLAVVAVPSPAWAGQDGFGNATLYTTAPANDFGTTSAATIEAGEPKGVA